MQQKRILVVEDDPAVALGLRHGLSDEGYAVTVVSTGAEALEVVHRNAPDLVVLDVRLPDINGFDVCRAMRAIGLGVPILVLTVCAEEADKVLGLEVGADDYVTKPYSMRELIARIRAQLRRTFGDPIFASSTDIIVAGDLVIDRRRMRVSKRGQTVWLTPVEFRLLVCLASNPGQVFSREQLMDSIWGYEADNKTAEIINTHICHLRKKLEDDPDAPCHIHTVRGMGYTFEL